jgi:hypothetical protein
MIPAIAATPQRAQWLRLPGAHAQFAIDDEVFWSFVVTSVAGVTWGGRCGFVMRGKFSPGAAPDNSRKTPFGQSKKPQVEHDDDFFEPVRDFASSPLLTQ